MTIPIRAWEAPQGFVAGGISRGFAFADSMSRDPDEFSTWDHFQELLSPILDRLRQADLTAALRATERLRRQKPDNALLTVEHARLLLANGDSLLAAELLNQVLIRKPQHLEALKLLGFAHLQQGDIPRAMALFTQAVRRSPADSFSQINRHALRRRMQYKLSLEHPALEIRPVVATSLPPRGIETSKQAVHSWLERGLKVLSINTGSERDQLSPHFPDVEFCLCEETAQPEFGKDYQYLDTILDALAQTGHPLCGIINADIILRGEATAWDQLCGVASRSFVYGSRVNVQSAESRYGTLLEPGFDFFLFPSAFLAQIPRTGFIMGLPAWDVFLPAWMARCGLPRAFCYSPVATHIEHSVQWSRTMNSRFMAMALSWFSPELAAMVTEDSGCHTYLRIFTGAMSQILNKAPKSSASPLFCSTPQLDSCIALVDLFYWTRNHEETLLMLS
jgi:tetratricopeptide (TPR) repeat protein